MTNDLLQRAKEITGWMTKSELQWLYDQASKCNLVIELGTWHGRSTMALRAAERVICVDAWSTPEGLHWGPDLMAGGLPFEVFFYNHKDGIDSGQVVPYVVDMRSRVMVDVLIARHRGAADLVFIDADHSAEGVWREIELAKRLCRPGGIICGHDYGCQDWPGVQEVVDKVYPHAQVGAHSIWFVTHE